MSEANIPREHPIRACVIDLGTNSFHMVIVDAYTNGAFEVVDRIKEMVRMGEGGLAAHRLTDAAMERGLRAMKRIRLLADGWQVSEYLAYATSAIREAMNGGLFIQRVKEEVGIHIRPISGEQEAKLIYKGVRRALNLPEPALLVDIGEHDRGAIGKKTFSAGIADSARRASYDRDLPLDGHDRSSLEQVG